MKTYHDLSFLEISNHTVCGLGNFDGIHRGHQKLISELVICSKKEHGLINIYLFSPSIQGVMSE